MSNKPETDKNESCGHVPARPDVSLTLCWKCGIEIVADPETHLWRPLTPTEKTVRLETVRQIRNMVVTSSASEVGRLLYEKFSVGNAPSIRLAESIMGSWIIINGQQEDLAWSGSRWVPHMKGLPERLGSAHLCNFPTRAEAAAYVKEHFPAGQLFSE